MQNQNNSIDEQLAKYQRETIFAGNLPSNIKKLVKMAFCCTTPFHLRMTHEEFKEIVAKEPTQYSILDINCILGVIKMLSANALKMSFEKWVVMQDDIEKCAVEVRLLLQRKDMELKSKANEASKEKGLKINLTPQAQA